MAIVTPTLGGHRCKPLSVAGIAHVVNETPGAIERGGAEKILVPTDRVTGGIANSAVNTFDGSVRRHPRRTPGADRRDRIVAALRRHKTAVRSLPLLEEGRHVDGKVLNHRQVGERT